jgi:AraC-like DNA-binding protein
VSEIAYRVGFKSAAHFSRMFKQKFKVSPRQYRTPDCAVAQPMLREPQPIIADGGQSRH